MVFHSGPDLSIQLYLFSCVMGLLDLDSVSKWFGVFSTSSLSSVAPDVTQAY